MKILSIRLILNTYFVDKVPQRNSRFTYLNMAQLRQRTSYSTSCWSDNKSRENWICKEALNVLLWGNYGADILMSTFHLLDNMDLKVMGIVLYFGGVFHAHSYTVLPGAHTCPRSDLLLVASKSLYIAVFGSVFRPLIGNSQHYKGEGAGVFEVIGKSGGRARWESKLSESFTSIAGSCYMYIACYGASRACIARGDWLPKWRILLTDLNPHKAMGPKRLSPLVLWGLGAEIAPTLTSIYRKSLAAGTIPNDWKQASVTPTFKKKKKKKKVQCIQP